MITDKAIRYFNEVKPTAVRLETIVILRKQSTENLIGSTTDFIDFIMMSPTKEVRILQDSKLLMY